MTALNNNYTIQGTHIFLAVYIVSFLKHFFSAKTRESCSTYYEIMLILYIYCNKEEHFLPIKHT